MQQAGSSAPTPSRSTGSTAHAETLDLDVLRRPRIILLAADFPPVVTATAVWLNEMDISVTLIRFQAYRAGSRVMLTVSQVYPVPNVEDFTVTPRQAELRAQSATKKRTQDTSVVRRLVDTGFSLTERTSPFSPTQRSTPRFAPPLRHGWRRTRPGRVSRGRTTWTHHWCGVPMLPLTHRLVSFDRSSLRRPASTGRCKARSGG